MTPSRGSLRIILGISAALCAAPAAAQVIQPPAGTSAPCAPSAPGGLGAAKPPASRDAAPAPNLSDTLARSNGVICPPANVDPQMKAPTPDAGNTPVIPPPGSPGGDPSVQPK